jgi:AmmeMemoRadiSam system protein A
VTAVLAPAERRALLEVGRQALTAAVLGWTLDRPALALLPPALASPGACFVTLTCAGRLRGCIGGLEASLPLAHAAHDNTIQAALYDFRFAPVRPAELDLIDIELSILSEPRRLVYRDAADLLQRLRPGQDGVVLAHSGHRATFLPQVWARVPSPADFLSLLCQKLAAPEDEWRRGRLDVFTYQAEKIGEHDDPG